MTVTKVLQNQAGIQYQGVQDFSEADPRDSLLNVVVAGEFKRGRFDKPMKITADNIRAMLGYDPTNLQYMAIEDMLNTGAPFVWVVRVSSTEPLTVASYLIPAKSQYQQIPSGTYHLSLKIFENNTVQDVLVNYTITETMQLTYLLHYLLEKAGLSYTGNSIYPENDAVELFTLFDTSPFATTGNFGSDPEFNIVEKRSVEILILKTSVANSVDIYDYLFDSGNKSAKVRSDGYMATFPLPK